MTFPPSLTDKYLSHRLSLFLQVFIIEIETKLVLELIFQFLKNLVFISQQDKNEKECKKDVANIIIEKENFCSSIDKKVQSLRPKNEVPGVSATLNSFRFSQPTGKSCEDKFINLLNEKQGFCFAFTDDLKKLKNNNNKKFVTKKLKSFCSSSDEKEKSIFKDFDDEKELTEEEKEENKKKFEDQENLITTPATGKN